jgi:predicted nucleic acid-binding protein
MDNQTQFRVHMETEAILGILSWCETGNAELLSSVALKYEVDHNSHPVRKSFVQEALAKSSLVIQASDSVERYARNYVAQGIKELDALHLACAIDAQADYFCTCDDKFLKRAKQIEIGRTLVVSPLELIEVISHDHSNKTFN